MRSVSALAWLQEQLDDLKGELEGSELALHQFKRDNNILSVSLEDRQNIIANDITDEVERGKEAAEAPLARQWEPRERPPAAAPPPPSACSC